MKDETGVGARRSGRRKEFGGKINLLVTDDMREFIDSEVARTGALASEVIRDMLHEARVAREIAAVGAGV